uniref:Uncharacterized protein n=1 Tax=Schistosoma japonicum TaxID=6182 RepID=C7TYL7_SCHJA|nr:hypothetical protein [Schistosoma japonicum]
MAYVLCCLTTISMYFIILFVDMTIANDEYYLHSEKMIFKGFPNIHYKLHNKSYMFKDIGFQIHVHGKTLKSAYILQHGLVYMADEFKNGSSIRSFEIVDAKLSKNHDFDSVTEGETFIIIWHHLVICKFLPYTYVSIYMQIYQNGTVEFYLSSVIGETKNCNITIEISDGICQVNGDGSVTMLEKKVLTRAVYTNSTIVAANELQFTPSSDMTIANDEYYLHFEKKIYKSSTNIHYEYHNEISMFKDIGFQIHVHGKTLKSAYILQHGVVYMADEFNTGSSMRSFEIVNAISKDGDFATGSKDDTFYILWYNLRICKSHPKTTINLGLHIRKNGNVEFHVYYVYNKNNNCNITIEISDGICQVNADKSVTMMGKRVIKSVDYPGSSIVDGKVFGFTPILANVTM